MERTSDSARDELRSIARNAMIERGLLPDFSPAALAELKAIVKPAGIETSLRDLRSLPWVSIDNDDSRDLDQLSVAESQAGGATRMNCGRSVVSRKASVMPATSSNTLAAAGASILSHVSLGL